MTTQHLQTNLFDAAKHIAEALQGLTSEQQFLALRFAAESLGISGPVIADPKAANPTSQHNPQTPETVAANLVGSPTSDIRSFARSKQPKSDTQMSAVVAYYYRFAAPEQNRKEAITPQELTEAIRLIGNWEQPKNPKFTLQNARTAGYLDSAGGGAFKINSVGENLVTMTLGSNGSDDAGPSGKKRKPKQKSKSAKANRKSK